MKNEYRFTKPQWKTIYYIIYVRFIALQTATDSLCRWETHCIEPAFYASLQLAPFAHTTRDRSGCHSIWYLQRNLVNVFFGGARFTRSVWERATALQIVRRRTARRWRLRFPCATEPSWIPVFLAGFSSSFTYAPTTAVLLSHCGWGHFLVCIMRL